MHQARFLFCVNAVMHQRSFGFGIAMVSMMKALEIYNLMRQRTHENATCIHIRRLTVLTSFNNTNLVIGLPKKFESSPFYIE